MAPREREKMVAVPAVLSFVSAWPKLQSADNDIAVPSFILSGAPFTVETANIVFVGSATSRCCFEGGFSTNDPGAAMINLDAIDDCLQVGFTRLDGPQCG
jgi:hypothetical protein